MINYKHKCIFIHIPKTAGSSIEAALWKTKERVLDPNKQELLLVRKYLFGLDRDLNKWLQHLTLQEAITYKYIPEKHICGFFKFSFVRNPWDRVVSEWKWIQGWKKASRGKSLKEFLYTEVTRDPESQHNLPQHKFIYDEAGNLLVDFVGRFENLQEDFDTICDKIGVPQKNLPHWNKTNHKHYTEYYDNETRQIIKEIYRKDIEYFGYKFGA